MKEARGFLLILLLASATALLFLPDLPRFLLAVLLKIRELGFWGPVLYVILYVLACLFFVPGSMLTLSAGFLFGVVWGSVLVSAASVLGACAAFLTGRYLARQWVEKRLMAHPSFRRLDQAVHREGWKIVGLTRLSPLFPFNFLNYFYGLTGVSFRDYLIASWIGMLPGTVLYVYLGSIAHSLLSVGFRQAVRTPAEWAFYGFGLLATLFGAWWITRTARRALSTRLETSKPGEEIHGL